MGERNKRFSDYSMKVTFVRLCVTIAAIALIGISASAWDALNVALGAIMGLCIAAPVSEPSNG